MELFRGVSLLYSGTRQDEVKAKMGFRISAEGVEGGPKSSWVCSSGSRRWWQGRNGSLSVRDNAALKLKIETAAAKGERRRDQHHACAKRNTPCPQYRSQLDYLHHHCNFHSHAWYICIQICRKICGLGCMTRALVHAWFMQPGPHIFLHFCIQVEEMW